MAARAFVGGFQNPFAAGAVNVLSLRPLIDFMMPSMPRSLSGNIERNFELRLLYTFTAFCPFETREISLTGLAGFVYLGCLHPVIVSLLLKQLADEHRYQCVHKRSKSGVYWHRSRSPEGNANPLKFFCT